MSKGSLYRASFSSTSKNYFPRTKYQSCLYLTDPPVNNSWKTIIFHPLFLGGYPDDIDWPTNLSICYNIGDPKITDFGLDAEGFGYVSDCFPSHFFRIFLRLRTYDDHFSGFEYQNGTFGISLSQYNSGESFFVISRVLNLFSNKLKIKLRIFHVHFGKGHNILNYRSRLCHWFF